MKKYISISLLLLLIASCDSLKTHGKFITEQQDAWMDGYVNGLVSERKDDADRGLVYCRANPNEKGGASPVCYKPKFQ